MQIIKGDESYSKKIIRKNYFELYGFLILSLSVLIIYLITSFQREEFLNTDSFVMMFYTTLGGLMTLFIIFLFKKINKFISKKENNINKAKVGDLGEKMVLNKLTKILDDNYTVYPNFKIPGRKFDVDLLIVGPKGVIAMEIKNSSNNFSFSEKEVLRIKGSGYTQEVTTLLGNADPRVKLKNHCKSLNYYIFSLGLKNIRVRKVLVFVNTQVSINGKAGVYIVKRLGELNKYFEDLNNDDLFSPEYCRIINDKLADDEKNKGKNNRR